MSKMSRSSLRCFFSISIVISQLNSRVLQVTPSLGYSKCFNARLKESTCNNNPLGLNAPRIIDVLYPMGFYGVYKEKKLDRRERYVPFVLALLLSTSNVENFKYS